MVSILPETVYGIVIWMPGELIDHNQCGTTPELSGIRLLMRGGLELVFGLIWAVVSYGTLRLCRYLINRYAMISRLPLHLYFPTVGSLMIMVLLIGIPLGFLTYNFHYTSLVTENCPVVVNRWVVLEESIAIPIAFGASCAVAGFGQKARCMQPD